MQRQQDENAGDRRQAPQDPQAGYAKARRWPRFAVDLSLRVRIPSSAGKEYVLAHGRDVSQGGMALYVPLEFEIGDIAELELSFPGVDAVVTLQATVRNREGFKYGVEFLQPTTEQQNIILTNLHRLVR